MTRARTRLGPGGRVVIPAAHRKALGLRTGDELVIERLDDRGLRILTVRQAIREAQALVRRYVPAGSRLSQELIEERRRESGRE